MYLEFYFLVWREVQHTQVKAPTVALLHAITYTTEGAIRSKKKKHIVLGQPKLELRELAPGTEACALASDKDS